MQVSGLLHRGGVRIVAVGDIGRITAQLFDQGNECGDFLLGQQAHVQVQLGPLLRQLALAGLGNQDDDGGQQGAEPHEALEPNKWSGVEGCDGKAGKKTLRSTHPVTTSTMP